MAQVIWTGQAVEDLRQIHEFIARDSKHYASVTIRKIRSAAGRLRDFPESGGVVPELPESPYRMVLVGHYRVVYRYVPAKKLVLILAVIHGSRLLPPVIEDR